IIHELSLLAKATGCYVSLFVFRLTFRIASLITKVNASFCHSLDFKNSLDTEIPLVNNSYYYGNYDFTWIL
ncbi:MAG: hypothetical protein KBF99_12970, partial [Leptospiraceae bacterium]|nr:hypothetical protein [Leptospiraceae bacterium]